jgi:hypothetical protein
MTVISLSAVIHAKRQSRSLKLLDAVASKTVLETCLTTLNFNGLDELEPVKLEIKKAIKKMVEIENAQKEN